MSEREPDDGVEPPPLDAALDGGPQLEAEPPLEPLPHETARLPEVAPDAAAAPSWESLVTQAMDQVELDAEPPVTAATVAATVPPPADSSSSIDALFGETQFREYQEGLDHDQRPFAARPTKKQLAAEGGTPPRGLTKGHKVLLWIAGGVLAVLALIALFLLGLRLPDLLAPVAGPTPSASPSASPEPTAPPVGPVEPGLYRWNELLGGECLDPFIDPWQDEFTVVDCALPHPAQMVFRGVFPETIDAVGEVPFPGAEALQAQISLLCSAPGVVDLAAASPYTDAQFQGSYPVTEEQWQEDPTYYCFVNRSSGEPLTGSVAVPQQPAAPAS